MKTRPKPLRPGDAITALARNGQLVWLRVERVRRNWIDTLYAGRNIADVPQLAYFPVLVSNEGIAWCRGHMTVKDQEAAAMLAVAAMT